MPRGPGSAVAGPLRLPRRFGSHLGALGNAYRRHFQALEAEYGPFTSALAREAAADAAEAFVRKLAATRAWQECQQKRVVGKGRRPRQADVIKLAKRCALDTSTYEQQVNRLRDLVGHRSPTSAHAQLVAKYGGHSA